jgi:hypothetical protein
MPGTTTSPAVNVRPAKGLLGRVFGVVMSPGETYAAVVAHPRSLGVMVIVIVISAAALAIFLSTELGQSLALEQQIAGMESFGFRVTDAMIEQIEARMAQGVYFAVAGQIIVIPLITLALAGIGMAVFNVLLGGEATFRQMFAVVAHSQVIGALAILFMMPLNYAREAMSNPTSLAIFLPMLDEMGFLARLLGAIDLFRIWWLVNLAVGLAVLYKRKTGPIAASLLAAYGVIALVIAGVMTALSGRSG